QGMGWQILSCRICFSAFRPLLFRSPVLRFGTSTLKGTLRLKVLPKLAFICLGFREASLHVASCQKKTTLTDTRPLPYSKCRADHLYLNYLLWKLCFAVHLGLRALILMLRFGPLLVLYPICFMSTGFAAIWRDQLLKATETSGPTFIKLGQWFSTRQDLFSTQICDMFSKLHVHVIPHTWDYTKHCFRSAFGASWKEIFKMESKDPMGLGCLTQVYRAYTDPRNINNLEFQKLVEDFEKEDLFEAWEIFRLKGIFQHLFGDRRETFLHQSHKEGFNGPHRLQPVEEYNGPGKQLHCIPVAIKVLHPGIEHQVALDLIIMKAGSWLLSLLPKLKWLRLPEVIEEFEILMRRQIDLRYEAENLERFRENFKDVESVRFPMPLRPFVTKRVLVETFEDSEPISQYLKEHEHNGLKQWLARMGVKMLLKMILVDNFVHGDLHLGKLRVQGAGQLDLRCEEKTSLVDMCDTLVVNVQPSCCPFKLVFLGADIVAQLQPPPPDNIKATFNAIIETQEEWIAELFLAHARASEGWNTQHLKSEMVQLVMETRKSAISLGKVQVGDFLAQVLHLLKTHKVKMESNAAVIIITLMVVESLGKSLDPKLDMLDLVRPLLLESSIHF
uniref:AarF domain containing kinase 2 n=1 Tax=Callorhinchus milii TaxID=7868 RepID=A0A4W3IJB4_CALMI